MPSPDYSATRESLPALVVILGPTAVGKTEVALQLAGRLDGEIVQGRPLAAALHLPRVGTQGAPAREAGWRARQVMPKLVLDRRK